MRVTTGKPIQTRLSRKEIDALLALTEIADAGDEGEGDYQGYDYISMHSAKEKLAAMRDGNAPLYSLRSVAK